MASSSARAFAEAQPLGYFERYGVSQAGWPQAQVSDSKLRSVALRQKWLQ